MTSALESEVYWSLKNEVLIELRELLVDKLQYEKTLDYLRSKRVFDRADCDEIEAERTPTKKRAKFLDILGDKGPTAFDQLCFAIQKKCKGQEYLLDIILTTFDRKKQERSFKELPPTEPPDLDGGLSPPCDDPKLVVMVTGLAPDTCEVDLNNLPGPGDPGAPIPPDEIEPTHGQQSGQSINQTPLTPPPSYDVSELPPPYSPQELETE